MRERKYPDTGPARPVLRKEYPDMANPAGTAKRNPDTAILARMHDYRSSPELIFFISSQMSITGLIKAGGALAQKGIPEMDRF